MPSLAQRTTPLTPLAQAARAALLGAAALAAVPAVLTSAHAQEAAQAATDTAAAQSFAIPPGPLAHTISRFAAEAGVQLSVDARLTANLNSPGLQGRHTAASGFAALLDGTGLVAVQRGNGYTLQKAPAAPQPAGAGATLPVVTVAATSARPGALSEAYAGGQVARGGRLGFLGNADVMDTPLSIVSYTAQAVEDQQARTIGEVAANDASVRLTSNSNGFGESFSIRGFPINDGNIGDTSFDGLYGVAPNFQASAVYAERIEIIKGPTALLGGIAPNGALGGSLNIVPKRAGDEPLTRLTLEYETSSQFGARADVGRRFGENKEWGIRVNGLYRNGDTERDKQEAKTLLGSLGLDYRGSRLRASLDYVDQRFTVDAPSRQPTLGAGAALPSAPDARRNLAQAWDVSLMRDRSLLARVEYEFSDSLSGYLAAGAARSLIDDAYGVPTLTGSDGSAVLLPAKIASHMRKQAAEAGLRGRLHTGAVEHRWNLGANIYRDEMDMGYQFGTSTLASNIYHPIDYPEVSLAAPVENPLSENTLRGLALADTMVFADDRVLLTLGVRHQEVRTKSLTAGTVYDQHALTPMLGVVVKPRPDLSLFANYIEGLTAGGTAPSSALNAGDVFAPYKAKQYEAGVKYDLGSWLGTASVFQITKPSGQLGTDRYYRIDAEQRNRGVELSLMGEPVRGLRPLAGLTWMDGKLTKASSSVQGNKAPGVPNFQANLGLEWDVPAMPGLTLTGRVMHTASQYVNQANTQKLPAWSRWDVGARYATRIASHPVAVRLQVLNLTDKHYWSGINSWGGLSMGDARTVRLSTQIDF